MKEERRQSNRIVFRVRAELSVQDLHYRAEEISNLSLGGCLLPISEELALGTACQVEIHIGGTSSELNIRVEGEILRCNEKGVAVKFTKIGRDSLLHLQNIIRHSEPYSESAAKEFQFKRGIY
jgi:hypothetical protein